MRDPHDHVDLVHAYVPDIAAGLALIFFGGTVAIICALLCGA